MTKLIGMCGLSFSGKTTLARQIARRTGALYLSLDAINEERGLDGGQGVPPAEWEKTSVLAVERATAALQAQTDVVLDDTLCFRWLRERYVAVAQQAGADFRLVYVATPIAEIRAAMVQNETTRARSPIAPEVFAHHLSSFEEPGSDEGPLVFDRSESRDAWLHRHF